MIKLNRTVEAISKQNKRRQMEENERQREEEWDEDKKSSLSFKTWKMELESAEIILFVLHHCLFDLEIHNF